MRRRPQWRRCLAVVAAAVLAAAGVVLPPGGVPPANADHNAHLDGLTLTGSATRDGSPVTFTLTATKDLNHSPTSAAESTYTVHVPHDLATIKFTPTWTDTAVRQVNLRERPNSSPTTQGSTGTASVTSSGLALTTGSTPRYPAIVVVDTTGSSSSRVPYYFNLEYDLLVTNFGQTASSNTGNTGGQSMAQLFTTGSAAGGYALEGIDVEIGAAPSSSERENIGAELWSVSGGNPNMKLHDLTVPAHPIAAGPVTFTAPANTTLSPSTTYALLVYTSDSFNLQVRRKGSGSEDAGAAGWSIGNAAHWIAARTPATFSSYNWGTLTVNQPLSLRVLGTEQQALPQITLTSDEADGAVAELDADREVELTATLPAAAGSTGVSVTFAVSGDDVTSGDYELSSSTVLISSGSTSGTTTLTILNDAVDEDSESWTVSASANGYSAGSLSLTVDDDDTAGVTVSETALSVVAGAEATYTVKLNSEPTADVTVTPSVSPSGKATVSGAMTFTGGSSGNWATAQTVTVTGAQAGNATVSHAVASTDTDYSSAASVSLTVTAAVTLSSDADLSGLVVEKATGQSAVFSSLSFSPAFARGTTSYSAGVPHAITHVKVEPTSRDADASKVEVGISGGTLATVARGSKSAAIPLDVGDTVIDVKVTAEDGSTEKNYEVTVTRGAANLLVTNFGQSASTSRAGTNNNVRGQGFTTGANTGGYTLEAVKTATGAAANATQRGTISAELWSSSGTSPGEKLADLVVPAGAISAGEVSFAAPSNTPLAPSTLYFLVLYTSGSFDMRLALQNSVAEDATSLAGWSISDMPHSVASAQTPGASPSWSASGSSTPQRLEVTGAAADVPGAPTSLVATAGVSQLGLTWRAPASGTVVGYDVHYTSAPTSGNGAVTNGAAVLTVANPDPDDGWVDAGHTGTTAAATITGLAAKSHRVRVRAVYAVGGAWVHTTGTPDAPALPRVSLSASPTSVSEGGATAQDRTVTVTARLTAGVSGGVTVPLRVTGAAVSPGDRGTLTGITIASGATTGTGTITVATDMLVEADETFTVALDTSNLPASVAAGSPSSVTITIDDDDTPAAPSGLAAAAGNAQLSLSWSATTEVLSGYVVQYTSSSTVGNSAAARTDGDAGLGWVPGGTPAAAATAHTVRDLTNGDTYRVRVRAVSAAGNGAWGFASGQPAVPVSTKTYGIASAASVREGSSASLTISLGEAAPAGGLAFTVTYGYSGDSPASAADLDSAPTRVSVTANATSVSLSVPTKADTDVEADETFTVSIRPATATGWSVASGGTAEATVTITDDDAPAAPTGLAASGNGKLKLTWTKSSGVLRGYEVHYTSALVADVADDAMASGNDVATGWLVSSSTVAAGDDPEHTISGLANGTTYRVRVRAVSAGGTSGWAHASGRPAVPRQPTVTLSVASGSVTETEADQTITLTATLSEAPTTAVTVSVAATNASEATASADYVLPASITVAAMAMSGTASVTIKGDMVVELDETLVLEPSAGGHDSAGTLTITIVDNDVAAAPSGLAVRGESAKLALSWTKPAGTLSGYDVHYTSASATAAPSAQAVQTGANPSASAGWVDAAHTGTDTGHTISGLINDTLYRVRVRAVSDARKGAWGFVSGTPAVHAVKVSAESVAVEVGETVSYTVRLATKPTGSVTVRAQSDDDDKATVRPASYTFTPSDWNTEKTFTVTGVAVGTPGIDHDVQTSTDATRYPTTLSVDDVDVNVIASTKTYKIDYSGPTAEGSDASLTVTLGRAPTASAGRDLSVTYSYSGSTATTADTGTTPATVTVAQSMTTATLRVPIAQDNLVEGAESFTVTIGAPAAGWSVPSGASATATVTIADDETANAKIAFGTTAGATAVHIASAAEDKSSPATVLVPVTVSARPQTSTSFSITAAGTATGGAAGDYTVPASVSFGPTDTAETDGSVTKNVTVTLRDDSLVELDETVELQIAAADATPDDLGDLYVRHASGAKATVTITDDEADDGPTVAFGADAAATAEHEASVAENVMGGMLSVPVTVSALPGASTTFEVEVLSSGTATQYDAGPPEAVGDFRITTKSVTFGPADASMTQNVSIAIQNDALVEAAQTIKLRLAAARASTDAGYDVGDLYGRDAEGDPATDTDGTSSDATVTITDDEAANAKIAFGSDAAATARHAVRPDENVSGGKVSVPITISAAPESDVTFSVEVSGLATEGTDYSIAAKSFTFTPAGALTQNLEITITDDDLVENDQAIELQIKAARPSSDMDFDLGDYYVRHAQGRLATVTIADEDRDEAKIVIGAAVPTGTPVQYTATAAEGDGTLSVPVTISHLPETAVTFALEVTDVPDSVGKDARASADAANPTGNPKDYDFDPKTVSFDDTAGGFSKDLRIDIADDDVEEDNEFIGFQIAAADEVIDDLGDYYERVTDASTGLVTLTSDDAVSSVVLSLSGVTATAGGWFPVLEGTAVTVTATADIPVGPDGWSVAVSNPTLDQSGGFVRTQCRTNVALAGWACPSDYRLPGVFKIAEGQKSATATLTLVSDSRDETTEERMSLAAVATRGVREVAARKLDLRVRENASGISIDPPSGELIPGETVTYTVSLIGAAPTADVTVTPTSGDTGKATVSGALTFTAGASGNWETPQTVTVTAVAAGDVRIAHGTSSSDAAWNQLTGLGGFSAKVNAARNVFRVDPPRDPATEGGTAELTITLGALAPTGGLTFTVDRSRANDLEYLLASPPLQTPEAGLADASADLTGAPATVTVLENTRTVTLSDTVADDELAEGDEHYYVVISTATAGWARETGDQRTTSRTCAQDAACARVDIADDDTADLAVAFGNAADATSAHTAAAAESAGTVSVPVTVSALPAAEVAFDVEVLTGGTATEWADAQNPGDFRIQTKRVTFGPADTSATKNLDIAIADDADAEGDETIRLRITPARAPGDAGYGLGDRYARHQNGSQATVTITDNDGAVQISTADVTVRAGATGTYTVRLAGARPASAVTIDIASDDTDIATVLPERLTFDSTDWQQPQTVTVTGVADGTATITHTVGGSDAAYRSSLTVASVRVTVTALPTASISVSPNPVRETAAATVTVTLSEALAQEAVIPIEVAAAVGDSPAQPGDWTPPDSVTIAAGHTRGTTTLVTVRDSDSDDEKIDISLGALPAGLAEGTPATVRLEITDTGTGIRTPPPSVNTGGGPGGSGGGPGGGSGSSGREARETERLWGPDRYATSLAVAREVAAAADAKLTTVVLAGGHSWADALTAGPLAGALDAALLLTAPDGLPASTVEWVKELGVTEIIAVGSTEHISDEALEALADIDADIERITADDAEAASVAVARRVGRPETLGPLLGRTVIVASSRVFADALAAGPFAAKGPHPILLADKDGLHPHTAAYLAEHADHVVVMGGTAAISTETENQIRAISQANRTGDRPMAITRLGGTDRYDTAVKFARWLASPALEGRVCFTTDTVGLATGTDPADAAASAPLLARRCAPLVLTHPDRLPPIVASYLRRAGELIVFGGPKAINQTALDDWTR